VIDISERKRSEDALRQSEATTAMLIDSAPDAMLALDELGQIVRVNRQTEEMFGYAREELLGKRIKELLGPRILDLFQERKDAAANAPGSRFSAAVEVAGRHKDGGEFATDVTLNPLDMGGWRLFMVTVRDIRHRKAAEVSIRQLTDTLEERVAARTADLKREVSERETVEKALKETNAQFQLSVAALEKRNQEVTLLSAMIQMVECCQDADEAYQVMARHLRRLFPLHPGAIYMISASRNLIECAARWDDDTNAAPALTFTPKDCWALRRGRIYKVESPLAEMLCEHVEVGNELPGPYICAPLIAHSEALGILHLKYAATNGAAEPPDSALLQTVAEQLSLVVGNLRLRETLSQQNIRDPLTGLFNRRYMEESLQRDLQRAKRSGNSLTIAMVDVDHFKRFNDSFGHAAGDVVLREVAQLMKSKMRGSDVVCRYGGEEFAIISPEMTLEVARQKMDYLREELKKLSIRYQEQRLDTPAISIGLSAFPIHGADGEALLKSADEALYRAKKAGRDRVVVADRPADVNATEASVH
jgi:diguanylate cyclase (GGDEF)-like protein/PAS domain S-box-containing protein